MPASGGERTIRTAAELRELVGEPHPATAHKIGTRLDDTAVAFIARSPFLVMATVDPAGVPQASPRGDEPGFVRVLDDRTLLIPERKGNRLVMGLQNLLASPALGLLFLVPGTGETLRVEGRGELVAGGTLLDALAARGQAPVLALRMSVERVFFHCARAFLRARLWDPAAWPEVVPVSFGSIIAERTGSGVEAAAAIDARVREGYLRDL